MAGIEIPLKRWFGVPLAASSWTKEAEDMTP